jgi:hypothetical protein
VIVGEDAVVMLRDADGRLEIRQGSTGVGGAASAARSQVA